MRNNVFEKAKHVFEDNNKQFYCFVCGRIKYKNTIFSLKSEDRKGIYISSAKEMLLILKHYYQHKKQVWERVYLMRNRWIL